MSPDYEGVFGMTRPVCAADRPGPSLVRSGFGTDVSVVIPVYNVGPYLRDCLASVLTAARKLTEADGEASVEILCVDDGSTDASGRILDECAADGTNRPATVRLRVIHQPNGGVSAARNRGMDEAKGQIVAFIDGDDTFAPDALRLMWQVACAEGPDLIRYEWSLVRSHQDDVGMSGEGATVELFSANADLSPLRQAKCGAFVTISRALAGKLRWPLISHGEDPLFLLDCLHESRKSVVIRAPLANYLVRPDSASHASSSTVYLRALEFMLLAVDKLAKWETWPGIRVDTCAWLQQSLFGRFFRGWRRLPWEVRARARSAYWSTLRDLAVREDLFDEQLRRRCLRAAARESSFSLWLTVVRAHRPGRRCGR